MERRLKDSGIPWIGAIPEHWEVTKLARFCYEHYINNSVEHNQNLLSLSYGRIVRKDINTADGLLPSSFDTYQIVEPGNIVLRLTDLQNDKRSLRVGYVRERGIITSAYVALGMSPLIEAKYMYYLLHTADLCKVFYGFGGGVRQSGKWEDTALLNIPVPPLDEQQQIADYLDAKCGEIDELIGVEEQMISDLEAYRQSVITDVVTKGLNPNVHLIVNQNSSIPWVPEDWLVCKLKFLVTFRSGNTLTSMELKKNGEYPVYGANGCRGNFSEFNYDGNRILIGRVGAQCGNIHYTTEKIWCTEHALVSSESHCGIPFEYAWLAYALDSMNLGQYGGGTAQPVIASSLIENLSISIPPLAEQKEIADYLDAKCAEIDALIQVKREKIETLKQYRQSLIFETVTGKVNVADNVALNRVS